MATVLLIVAGVLESVATFKQTKIVFVLNKASVLNKDSVHSVVGGRRAS